MTEAKEADCIVIETEKGNWQWECCHGGSCHAKAPHLASDEVKARRGAYLHFKGLHRRKPRIVTKRL